MRRAFRRILILSDTNMMTNGCKTLISGVFGAAPGNLCGVDPLVEGRYLARAKPAEIITGSR
jgi:hypothetical protein